MENLERYFSITDMVVWNRERLTTLADKMAAMYGEGPFKIVGLRLHSEGAKGSFPVAVTIEFANKRRKEFDGAWFDKV